VFSRDEPAWLGDRAIVPSPSTEIAAMTRVVIGWRCLPALALLLCTLILVPGCQSTPVQPSEPAVAAAAPVPKTITEILEAAPPSDWRPIDPERLLILELAVGPVMIELAPGFAPRHVDNIATLVRSGYFDSSAIIRVHDNYVVQWADPGREDPARRRPLGAAAATLEPEFDRSASASGGFVALADGDAYAAEVGFVDGFPVAREDGREWLVHCYGMVGAGRDNAPDSGNGAELYAVIGHAPRNLDRNVTLVGRVVRGIEHFSGLPRGPAPMGFLDDPARHVAIKRVRLASAIPAAERPQLEALRVESASFEALVEARRNRRDAWYLRPAGRIDLCNVPLPVRAVAAPTTAP
jgi:peptidylprolyl isomerase